MSDKIYVHFEGLHNILAAFSHQDIPNFAILSARQLMFRHIADPALTHEDQMDEAETALTEYLTMLDKSNFQHLTLRVYEDVRATGIKAKTDWDGSFNFRINARPDGLEPGQNMLLSKISALEKKLQAYEDDDDEDDGVMGKIGKVLEVLEHPVLLPMVAPITQRILDALMPPAAEQMARVSGPTEAPTQDDLAINGAIIRLKKTVSDLGPLLTKMADMADKKPAQFNMYKALFSSMKV